MILCTGKPLIDVLSCSFVVLFNEIFLMEVVAECVVMRSLVTIGLSSEKLGPGVVVVLVLASGLDVLPCSFVVLWNEVFLTGEDEK